ACAPAGAWALAVTSALMATTAPNATPVQTCLRRKRVRSRLIIGIASGDLNHAPVGHSHRLEESERTAVPRRDELHADFVAGVKGVLSGLPDAPLCERGCGAEREYPLGLRTIRVLDRKRQRPVGVHELDLLDRARDLRFLVHI